MIVNEPADSKPTKNDQTLVEDHTSTIDQHQIQFTCISSAFFGICTAGFWYPTCIAIVVAVTVGILTGFDGAEFQTALVGEALASFTFIVLLGGVCGFMISACTGFTSIILVYWMNRSVGYPVNARAAAISAGSMAGYLPTVWIVFTNPIWDSATIAATTFLGPILAMLLGALGAAWSAKRYGGIEYELARYHKRHRLSVLHLMLATAWIAVTFAIANLCGGPGFAIAVGSWFGLQGLMLLAIHFCRRIRS